MINHLFLTPAGVLLDLPDKLSSFCWRLKSKSPVFMCYPQSGGVNHSMSDPQVAQLLADWVEVLPQLVYSRSQVRVKPDLLFLVADVLFSPCSFHNCPLVLVVEKLHYKCSRWRLWVPRRSDSVCPFDISRSIQYLRDPLLQKGAWVPSLSTLWQTHQSQVI